MRHAEEGLSAFNGSALSLAFQNRGSQERLLSVFYALFPLSGLSPLLNSCVSFSLQATTLRCLHCLPFSSFFYVLSRVFVAVFHFVQLLQEMWGVG